MDTPTFQVKPIIVHPMWLRICHWLNALAMLVMVACGWRIYNASPLFNFTFPAELTLGGWLGGALQWHFAGMWLFGINGVVYLLINIFSGRLKRKFWPLSPRELLGGYDNAHFIHFYAMSGMVGFVVIHLIMVALVPKTLLAMLRGR